MAFRRRRRRAALVAVLLGSAAALLGARAEESVPLTPNEARAVRDANMAYPGGEFSSDYQNAQWNGARGSSDDPTPVKIHIDEQGKTNWAGATGENWRGPVGMKYYNPGGACRQQGPCPGGKNQYPEASQVPYAQTDRHVDVRLDEDKGNMDPDGHYRTGEKYDRYGRVPTGQYKGQATTLFGYDFDDAYDLAGSPSGTEEKPLPTTRCIYSSMQNMKNPRGAAEDGRPNNNNGKGFGDKYSSMFHENEVVSKTNANCVGATNGNLN